MREAAIVAMVMAMAGGVVAQGALAQLGLTEAAARTFVLDEIKRPAADRGAPIEVAGTRAFLKLPPAARGPAATALFAWAKSYVSSPAFNASYNDLSERSAANRAAVRALGRCPGEEGHRRAARRVRTNAAGRRKDAAQGPRHDHGAGQAGPRQPDQSRLRRQAQSAADGRARAGERERTGDCPGGREDDAGRSADAVRAASARVPERDGRRELLGEARSASPAARMASSSSTRPIARSRGCGRPRRSSAARPPSPRARRPKPG